MPNELDSIELLKAATLAERLDAGPADIGRLFDEGRLRAAAELLEWRDQEPVDDWTVERRMARDGHEANQLLALLGEDLGDLLARLGTPDWLQDVAADLTLLAKTNPGESLSAADDDHEYGFLSIVAPLLRRARASALREIEHELQGAPLLAPDAATIEQALCGGLQVRLLRLVLRPLLLEMQVAHLEGLLSGDTPAERQREFLRLLADQSYSLRILTEYPVLTRQISSTLRQWTAMCQEFAALLAGDFEMLCETFFEGRRPGTLIEIDASAGDAHGGGRSVLLLRFSTGERLVYKPRGLAVDALVQELLTWINARGADPQYRTLRVVDRGDYGWVEFVAAEACRSTAEVERFYRRQGGYLALLYALRATDLHSENIVAAGEHPMLIDLEALFHHRVPGMRTDPATESLWNSVVSLRMLPTVFYLDDVEQPFDISGLGGIAGQATPFPVLTLDNDDNGQPRLTAKHVAMPQGAHQPAINGQAVRLADFAAPLTEGFVGMYGLLVRCRDELCAPNGPLAAFAEAEVRFIARPTQAYMTLLDQGQHPDRLRDGLARDQLFDRLWLRVRSFPKLAELVSAELTELHQNDVPRFMSRPGSRDVWTAGGGRSLNFFDQTALELVQERLQSLSTRDMERQLWMIRATLATLPDQPSPARTTFSAVSNEKPARVETLIAAACSIGDRLCQLSTERNQEIGWLTLLPQRRGWLLGPMELDLREGLPGVALFLAHLGMVSGRRQYSDVARRAARTVASLATESLSTSRGQSGLEGPAGAAYVLERLGELWGDTQLQLAATELRRKRHDAPGHNRTVGSTVLLPGLKVVSAIRAAEDMDALMNQAQEELGQLEGANHSWGDGVAGWLDVLAHAAQCSERPDLLKSARAATQSMIAGSRQSGWRCVPPGDASSLGLLSGLAGIGYGLLRLAAPERLDSLVAMLAAVEGGEAAGLTSVQAAFPSNVTADM